MLLLNYCLFKSNKILIFACLSKRFEDTFVVYENGKWDRKIIGDPNHKVIKSLFFAGISHKGFILLITFDGTMYRKNYQNAWKNYL